MEKIIKNITKNKIINLTINQGVTLALPLIQTPYLLRVLDVEVYGKLVFGQAVVAVLIIIGEWGYNWSAVEMKKNQSNSKNRYAINALVSQFIVALIMMIIWMIYCGYFNKNETLIPESIILLIANIVLPYWMYFIYDRTNIYARISIISKIISFILIIMFVKSNEDINIYFYIQGIPLIVLGIIGLNYVVRKEKIELRNIKIRLAFKSLMDSKDTFFSKLSITTYTTSVPIALGLVSGSNALALYTIADKIRVIVQALIAPVLDIKFYQNTVNSKDTNIESHLKKNRNLIYIGLISSLSLFFLAEPIILLIASEKYSESIVILRIMAMVPLFIVISNLIGLQYLYKNNQVKEFNKSLKKGAILGAILIIPMIHFLNGVGASLLVFVIEVFIAVLMMREAKKYDKKNINLE